MGQQCQPLASLLFYLAKCEKSNVKYVASNSHSLWRRHPNQISVADFTFAELFMGFDVRTVRIVYETVAVHIPIPTTQERLKKKKKWNAIPNSEKSESHWLSEHLKFIMHKMQSLILSVWPSLSFPPPSFLAGCKLFAPSLSWQTFFFGHSLNCSMQLHGCVCRITIRLESRLVPTRKDSRKIL